jgi:rhamnosyltransferase
MKVTVIMRTKNSESIVSHALTALFSQDFKDFELLVVDSGSTDGTLAEVAKYPHRLMKVEAGDYVPGNVLNAAIQNSTSPLIVFQNSDCVPCGPGVLGAVVDALEMAGTAAAFCRQVARPGAWTWVRAEYERSFPESGPAPEWMKFSLPFAGLGRKYWDEHHFYADSWGSEDTEWGNWATGKGYKVAYLPQATVIHSHNYSLKGIYGRKFIEGEADAFIYNAHRSVAAAVFGAAMQTARDIRADLLARDFRDIPAAPIRRAVDQWAWFKGNNHGHARKQQNDTDISTGQKTVLDRFEQGK